MTWSLATGGSGEKSLLEGAGKVRSLLYATTGVALDRIVPIVVVASLVPQRQNLQGGGALELIKGGCESAEKALIWSRHLH
jgi:hypothetical protein